MSWLDELHLDGKGAFRGVEFYVRAADRSAGRRTVVHEFPGSDKPQVEDLGRAATKSTLQAFVIGDNYMAERNDLWDAFNTPGAGPLVHPFWGRLTVTVIGEVRLRETTDEGGMARFTVNVVEAGEDFAPLIVPDTEAEVDAAVETVLVSLGEDFEDAWTVTDIIGAILDFAQDLISGINGLVSLMNTVNGYVNAAMNIVDSVGDAITALADTVVSLVLLPGQLVSTIADIFNDIMQAVSTVTDAWDSYFGDDETSDTTAGTPAIAATGGTPASGDERAEVLMTVFRSFAAYGDSFATVNETTPQREAQADNQAAMIALVRGISIAETCRAMSKIPFASYDQAVSVRDELADEFDSLLGSAGDTSYGALADLRAAISRHLTETSVDLPRVITHTPARTLPALVIAHQLYGDSKRDIEIIDRNDIRNPCMVNGGVELEVLSDA